MSTSERPFRVCHLGCRHTKAAEPSEQSVLPPVPTAARLAQHTQQSPALSRAPFPLPPLSPGAWQPAGQLMPRQGWHSAAPCAAGIPEVPWIHASRWDSAWRGLPNPICCQMVTLHSSSALHRHRDADGLSKPSVLPIRSRFPPPDFPSLFSGDSCIRMFAVNLNK